MKNKKLIIIAILFWLLETWFFGWNKKPSCFAESVCDWLVIMMVTVFVIINIIEAAVHEAIKRIKESEVEK